MTLLNFTSQKKDYQYKIERFIKAHENMYNTALSEIMEGKKQCHWIWYIFPQLKGLGKSYNSNYYGIQNLTEARDYLNSEILRSHTIELCNALLNLQTNDPITVFGRLDAKKLQSSMTLFDFIEPNSIFNNIITKFFNGERDKKTLMLIHNNP